MRYSTLLVVLAAVLVTTGCGKGTDADSPASSSVPPAPKASNPADAAATNAADDAKDAASPNGMPGGGPAKK